VFRNRVIIRPCVLVLILAGFENPPATAAQGRSGQFATTRPDPEGKATRVTVGVYVVDISEIDDVKQTLTADVYLILYWSDPRLADPQSSRRIMSLNDVWHPPFSILNQRSVKHLLPEVVAVDRQGNVEYRQRIDGTFSVSLNLRNFPLDEQIFVVRVVTPGESPADLELVPDERSGAAPALSIPNWAFGQPMSQADPLVTPDGSEIAGFTWSLPGQRRVGSYVYQFVIPLIFIVGMSWAAFWMAPEQLGPRQGIAVTSMLTVIAYRFVLANYLPRVAYLTRFDYLILGSTTLVLLVLVEVVITHRLMAKGRAERVQRVDAIARRVFPALFLSLIVGVFLL
jgi:hypothetical protein